MRTSSPRSRRHNKGPTFCKCHAQDLFCHSHVLLSRQDANANSSVQALFAFIAPHPPRNASGVDLLGFAFCNEAPKIAAQKALRRGICSSETRAKLWSASYFQDRLSEKEARIFAALSTEVSYPQRTSPTKAPETPVVRYTLRQCVSLSEMCERVTV